MKKHKGYYIDNIHFNSQKEIDEFLKKQAVDRFAMLNRIFAMNPSMEASVLCDQQTQRLHDGFGFSWEELEQMEVDAYGIA